MLILNKSAVSDLLNSTLITEILSNQAKVFHTLSSDENHRHRIQSPHRSSINGKDATILFMPSSIDGESSIKVVGIPKNDSNDHKQRRNLEASSLVFDSFGKVEALMDSSLTTGVRTAAGSAISTMLFLPPSKCNPKVLVLLGGGLQAYYHAKFLLSIYKHSITDVMFVGRDTDRTGLISKLGKEIQDEGLKIKIEMSFEIESWIRKADIICCCTPSLKPLFKTEWVKDGTHLNLIGSYKPEMQEVEVELIQKIAASGRLVVDSKKACEIEAGDLIKASIPASSYEELGSLITIVSDRQNFSDTTPEWESNLSEDPSKTNGSKTSLFKSVGFGAQDVGISRLLLEKSRELDGGKGIEVDF